VIQGWDGMDERTQQSLGPNSAGRDSGMREENLAAARSQARADSKRAEKEREGSRGTRVTRPGRIEAAIS
jgi:hypothetical protein